MTAPPPAAVTVVVPAYRGADDVQRCLDSVLRHAATTVTPFTVRVIDDASPEPEVEAVLAEVAAGGHAVPVAIERNAENHGFVRTVERAMVECVGDVVLLNADCVVTAGWLDRLADAATSQPDVATVTPLTGSGSLCTLPSDVAATFDLAGGEPQVDACAAYVAEHSLGLRPEVIAGVGFCMYVTRAALDACGGFDLESFGIGYGEEVDWCLRAGRLGFVHLVEDATFVHHRGGGSFGDVRDERMSLASGVLHQRYRFFRPSNRQERSADPLAVGFAALRLGLAPRDRDRPHVLQILHPPSVYGGTEKHLDALMDELAETHDFSVLHPVDSGFLLTTRWGGEAGVIRHELLLPGAADRVTRTWDEVAAGALRMALDLEPVDAVHVHNLIGHSLAPIGVLAELDVPVICSVHDLYLACSNHWLMYRNESACGIPDDRATCERCMVEVQGRSIEHLDEFRQRAGEAVGAVDRWVFPSRSAADHLVRVHDIDEERIEVIEHGSLIPVDGRRRQVDEALVLDAPLRVAFAGRGWLKKGLRVANAIADELADAGIEIHHLGELRDSASEHLVLHGPYRNVELPELLDEIGAQIVLLPGPYAETFGQVMTEALVAGRPVIGARYGALGERIRAGGTGWTFDPEDPREAAALLARLDRCRPELLRASQQAVASPIPTMSDIIDRYADLYASAKPPVSTAATAGPT